MIKKNIFIAAAILVSISLLLSACSASTAVEPDSVTLQSGWFLSTSSAGFFVADQKGMYAQENIDFTIFSGDYETDVIADLVAGNADFGICTSDSIISARLAGQDIVALASIFRQSPMVVMAFADSGIVHPQDLVGKTVGVISTEFDNTWDAQFLAMLKNADVDPDSINYVYLEEYVGANDLLSGRMDAASAMYTTNEPLQAGLDGYEMSQIYYIDYGINFYTELLCATGNFVRQNPDLVQRFVRTTFEGYQYAIENPAEAVEISLPYDENMDPELQALTMQEQIPLIDPGDAPLGYMVESVWQETQDILIDQGLISSTIDLGEAYTNEFVVDN
jgi:NitT/TauT family transport system substrate-binding protein